MKLAFITTDSGVFVTTDDKAVEYAKELQTYQHYIENIEIAPIGSSVQNKLSVKSYGDPIMEIDLDVLS